MHIERINLGAGSKPEDGWVNHDLIALPGIDVVHDLEQTPWPWADGEAAIIKAYDVYEHVWNWRGFIYECHRILAPGGVLDLHTTWWLSKNAYTDPDHKRTCTDESFDYFVPGTFLHEHYGAAYAQGRHFAKINVYLDGTELAVILKKL